MEFGAPGPCGVTTDGLTLKSHLFLSSTALPAALCRKGGSSLGFPVACRRQPCWKHVTWRPRDGGSLVCLQPGQPVCPGAGHRLCPSLWAQLQQSTGDWRSTLKHSHLLFCRPGGSKLLCSRPCGWCLRLPGWQTAVFSLGPASVVRILASVSVTRALNPLGWCVHPHNPITPKGPAS